MTGSATKQSIEQQERKLDCFAPLAMTARYGPHPRGVDCARALPKLPALEEKRAQGKPGARCTRGLVCNVRKKCAHEHTGPAEASRLSLRSGLPAYSALSSVTGLSCHRHQREVLLPANLTPASGRQDHTASPSASVTLVSRDPRVHRIPPRVRDDREPPLSSGETGRTGKTDLPDGLSDIFLRAGLDRLLLICPSGCFVAARSARSYLRARPSSRPASRPATEMSSSRASKSAYAQVMG